MAWWRPCLLLAGTALVVTTGGAAGQLYLQPAGKEHSYFTNDSFFITCFSGDPRAGIEGLTWRGPMGKEITNTEGRIHVEPPPEGKQGLGLVVEDVRRKDGGTYTCTAMLEGAELSESFQLNVHRSISFSGTPEVQYAPQGENFTVFCNARGEPKPIVSWSYNGNTLSNDVKYSITDQGLVVHGVTREDAGNYSCRAFVVTVQNSQMKEMIIQIKVQYAPEWKEPHMEKAYSSLGSVVSMMCESEGEPGPTFAWFREGDMLENGRHYNISHIHKKSILQVTVEDESLFGPYTCRVSNDLGARERIIYLTEGERAHPPGLYVSTEEPGTLQLAFNTPDEAMLDILGFRVQYRLPAESWDDALSKEFEIGDAYVLRNLSYDTKYVLRAAARNAAGYGDYSEEVTHSTKNLHPETVTGKDSTARCSASWLVLAGVGAGLLIPL